MFFKAHLGSTARCTSRACQKALRRSALCYIDPRGTVLCVDCYNDRQADELPALCVICAEAPARPDKITCSRKCARRRNMEAQRVASAELASAT